MSGAIACPDAPIIGDGVELHPYTAADAEWLSRLCREYPELADQISTVAKCGMSVRLARAYAAHWWGPARLAMFRVYYADGRDWGLIWALPMGQKIGILGFKIPTTKVSRPLDPHDPTDVLSQPSTAAKAIHLIMDWATETIGGKPFLAIPCREPRYIEWAKQNGIPYRT